MFSNIVTFVSASNILAFNIDTSPLKIVSGPINILPIVRLATAAIGSLSFRLSVSAASVICCIIPPTPFCS